MLSYNVLNSWVEKMMKKTLPVKIKTSDITALSTKDINKLKAGDIVLKKTGNQKHTYIVSYKEENQGICLTYVDATVAETVSYDYNTTTKEWVYNSTDSTPLEGAQYTAGDNINITGNVISATDTTYTAGAGISINGQNEISLSKKLYQHNIRIYKTSLYKDISLVIFTNSNTPMDFKDICQWLWDNNFKLVNNKIDLYEISGYGMDAATPTWIEFFNGCYVDDNPSIVSNYQLSGEALFHNITTGSYSITSVPIFSKLQAPDIIDTVVEIL